VVVSTARLNRMVDHAVGDLTVTAEAGLTFAQLQTLLQAENQFLAIDPAYPERATLGGIVATADTGSLRQRYGGIRDMLIGITFVRYDGQLVKAGGRVVKNVAGYDLMKLMTGAYGSLGLISQITFRTYPLQPASQTVVFSGGDEILKTLALSLRMSSLTPVVLDWLSPALMRDLGQADAFGLVARFQAATVGVTEQVQRLLELGKTLGLLGQVLDAADDRDWWQRLRPTLTPAPEATDGILAKVGVLPAEASQFLRLLDTLTDGQGKACLHAGSGLGLVSLATLGEVREVLLKLRSQCEAAQGYLTLLQAPAHIKQTMDVWGYTGNALDLMQRLKQQFDPAQLLNPGRFVAG
jgi:glycolate oxidase FAD binding subunit